MRLSLFPALLGLIILSGCTKPKDLEYLGIGDVRVLQWGLQESKLGVNIHLFNPNRQKLQLKQANVDVYINNVLMGNTKLDSTINIPKRDTFSIPIVLNVQSATAITNVIQTFSDTASTIKLQRS